MTNLKKVDNVLKANIHVAHAIMIYRIQTKKHNEEFVLTPLKEQIHKQYINVTGYFMINDEYQNLSFYHIRFISLSR